MRPREIAIVGSRVARLLIYCALGACDGGHDSTSPSLDPIASIELSGLVAPMLSGETTRLIAVVRVAGGSQVTDRALGWTTSNPAAVTVSSNGEVRAVGAGTAIVEAEANGVKDTTQISVVNMQLSASTAVYDAGTIVFTSGQGVSDNLYTIGPAGVARLTNSNDFDRASRWSPDGDKLSFVRISKSGLGPSFRIVPVAGGPETEVFDGAGEWSSDWSRFAGFSSSTLVIGAAGQRDIHTAVLPGLIQGVWWSPDGRTVAISARSGGEGTLFDLFLVNSDATSLRNVTNTANRGEVFADWKHDSSGLIVEAVSDSQSLLYTVSVGGVVAPLETGGPGSEPRWSPAGDRVVFTSRRTGNAVLYLVAAGGGLASPLTPAYLSASGARWSGDGSRLVFAGSAGAGQPQEIFVVSADRRDLTQLTDNQTNDLNPIWKR